MRPNVSAGIVLAVVLSSCWNTGKDAMVPFMDGLENRIVIVFEKGADPRDVQRFLDEYTMARVPHPGGGRTMRAEIEAVVKAIGRQGYDGYEIGFSNDASPERVDLIVSEMAASELVYRIYRDTDPGQILLSPMESPDIVLSDSPK